jgi:UDP-N-acetylmuramate dehydrogenase
MIIEQNIPLNTKNWFATGGEAAFFCQPTSAENFVKALEFATKNILKIFVLGAGANILISDEGFNGLVVQQPFLHNISSSNELIIAEAGVYIDSLIDYALDHRLLGLEEFSGIPGTVGGSTYINIHYFEHFLSQYIVSARIIDKKTCKIFDVDKDWFKFDYNTSTLQQEEHYLLSTTFKLKKSNSNEEVAYAKGRRDEIIRHRSRRYPTSNTCGSFFRNFHQDEISSSIDKIKIPYVAYYLDKIGAKGSLEAGKAYVSHLHSNMLVTKAGATSSDVVSLAREMQRLTYKHFGLIPQSECRFIGFSEYPLLKISSSSSSSSLFQPSRSF